ncbi:thioredoxin-disulfide reductase [Rubrivirga sp. S365]|uniref:Thioredoxin reductase n=1 Tax=Rubrivirga litoralis TaxID=3075598 RepID=A0ABU3BQB6_9BACT|nr:MULTISPECIES: thioredoxin-disulfide reductase [unclassified Rubrivirga]MDT0631481.1 thioredoxin-disulfide reductase [Rubrivirga sp. F394]MDT7855537.1 thioredoxin-disulfide reductase [Rubrivirga sp. S365]
MPTPPTPLPDGLDWGAAERRPIVIVGTGPAGFTAALYAARAGLAPLVVQGSEPGGQLTTTTDVENFPGYPDGVMGPDMMADLEKQAVRFGAELRWGTVTHVDFSGSPHRLVVDETTPILADAVVVSTGASAKYLGLENERRLLGRGVSACATCDGAFFRGEEIAIVGGGDTAMEEALFLTRFASTVHLIHRRDSFRASQIMQDRVLNHDSVRVHWNTVVTEVRGDDAVIGLTLEDTETGEARELPVTGFFVAIGHKPNTEIFAGWLDQDEAGYIQTLPDSTYTNVDGVFACGDAQDHVYRQAVTAAGTGCMAAIDAERWLAEHDVIEETRTETEYHVAPAEDSDDGVPVQDKLAEARS